MESSKYKTEAIFSLLFKYKFLNSSICNFNNFLVKTHVVHIFFIYCYVKHLQLQNCVKYLVFKINVEDFPEAFLQQFKHPKPNFCRKCQNTNIDLDYWIKAFPAGIKPDCHYKLK